MMRVGFVADYRPGTRLSLALALPRLCRTGARDHHAYLEALATRFTLTQDEANLAIVRAAQQALEREGVEGMVLAMLAAARNVPADGAADPYSLAHFFALAGDWETAVQRLNKTLTRHSFYYGIDPAFAQARHNERFLQILGEAGLPIIASSEL